MAISSSTPNSAWVDRGEILVKYVFNPDYVNDCRAIESRRWDGSLNHFSFSDAPRVRELTRKWGIPISMDIENLPNFNDPLDPVAMVDTLAQKSKAKELYDHSTLLEWPEFDIPGLALPLHPYQRAGVAYMHRVRRCILADQMGLGKGHPVGTNILTPSGWKKIEDLAVGENIVGSNGMPTEITGVFPRGILPIYKTTFNDGSSVNVDGDHIWTVKRAGDSSATRNQWKEMQTRELIGDLSDTVGNFKWRIPIVKKVIFENEDSLPLDPYLMGCLLGDGGLSHSIIFSTADEFMIKEVERLLPEGMSVSKSKGKYDYRLVGRKGKTNSIKSILKSFGLNCTSKHKYIPEVYLRSSVQDRMMLLRGLMDTDGSAGRDGTNEFSSVSKDLSDGVAELVQSLGGIVRRSVKQPKGKRVNGGSYHISYRVNVKMMDCPFLLPRKAQAWVKPTKYPPNRVIKSIDAAGEAEVICLSVSAKDQLYVTENYIVTHNTTQSISTVVFDQSLPVVIASKNRLKETIREDVQQFYPGLKISILNGGALKDIDQSDVIIVNYDIVSQRLPDIFNHGFNSLIVDESHYIKNGKKVSRCPLCGNKLRAVNSVNCPACGARGVKAKSRWSVRRTDAVMQLAHSLPDEALVLLLTGTPINIRPGELIRQLECIGRLKIFGGEWKFRQRYCPDNKTAINLKELNTKLRENCFVRRRTRDVYGQLPPVQHSIQRMVLSKAQRERYEEIERDVVHYLADKARQRALDVGEHGHTAYWNKRRTVERAEALVKINVLRSVIAEIKMEAMQDWIDNFLDSGDEKMVVFAMHISVVDGIYDAHREIAVKVRGDVTNADALEATHFFQEQDWCRMWVANLQSGKEGFTLTESKHVVFCEPEWSPTYHAQGVGRVYGRANNPHGATAYWLLAEDTIDFDMYKLLQERQVVIDAVTDGEEDTAEQEALQDALIKLLEERG